MPQKNTKQKTIKTPFGPVWVYSSVERAVSPLKKRDNLKVITAVGAVIIMLLTLLYAGFIDDRQGGKAFSGAGSGTPQDPFQISTCLQLQEMEQSLSSHYALINDIDCSDTVNWNAGAGFNPISYSFTGALDGRNFSVKNLYMNRSSLRLGLFYSISDTSAEIKNLHLKGGSIINTSTNPATSTGSVAGGLGNNAKITNVSSTASVRGNASLGGLIGYTETSGAIVRSSYSGNLTGTAGTNNIIGGITGLAANSIISDSYFIGNIQHENTNASYSNYCGGIIGQAINQSKTISRTYSAGNIICNAATNFTGGIIGQATTSGNTIIENSYSTTSITANGRKGAVVGEMNDATAITFTNVYYDVTRSTLASCEGFWVPTGCTAINTANSNPNYFFGNTSAAPLNTWDFSVVWKTTSGGYPTLRTPPSVTTEAATNLTQNLATLNGTQWSTLNTATTARGFEWGTDTNYGNTINLNPPNPTNFGFSSIVGSRGLTKALSIAQDSFGNLYVADNYTNVNQVRKYDQNGNFLASIGATLGNGWTGSRNGDLNGPSGVAVDASNNLYVAEASAHRIQKFDANGNYITKWGSFGTGNGQFNSPSSIAIDSSGNIYVSDEFNHRIQKFDANGNYITKWGTNGTGNGQLNYPRGITYDTANDRILVADTWNYRIQEFSTTGAYISKWGSFGTGNGQFSAPQQIDVASNGDVYVTDSTGYISGTQRVQVFTTSNRNYLRQWGSEGNSSSQYKFIYGLLAHSNGNIYTSDLTSGRIQAHAPSGSFIAQYAQAAISLPNGVYIDNNNNLYVTSPQSSIGVKKFDSSGNYKFSFDQNYQQDDIALDGLGNIYITSFQGVRKYSPDGTLLNNWTHPTSTGFNLSIDVDSQGNIYTVDTNNYVQKFNSSFSKIGGWGSFGTGAGQFTEIGDLVIDNQDNVFVFNYGTSPRVQKFTSSGSFLLQWGSGGSGNGQFSSSNTIHLALDSQNNVYIQDPGAHRFQKFSNNGVYISKFGAVGANDTQFYAPWGIAINSSDQVVIADYGNLSIKTFNQPATFTPSTFTSTLSGLSCGTTYHYRSFATNGDGTSYGNDVSFTTSPCSSPPPSVTTLSATDITQSTATLNGTTTSDGVTTRGIQWGASTLYGNTANDSTALLPTTSPITINLTNLACATTYHFRAFATNSFGTGYGQDLTFTTAACSDAPEVTTLGASNIDGDSATFSGLASPRWLATRGFQWTADPNFNTGVNAENDITDATYTEADAWGNGGTGQGQLDSPFSILIDANNHVYILDRSNCKVVKYDRNGNFMLEWGSCGSAAGQLLSPRAMAIDQYSNIYVADTFNNRVQKFDSSGNYLLGWGSEGDGNGQFRSPRGITVDSQDNVYVSEINGGDRVQKFDSNGNYLGQWGSSGSGNGQFITAFQMATDSNDTIYVVDPDHSRVQKFDTNGNYLGQWGSFGTGNGQFQYATGIAVDSLDNIYITDPILNKIQRFDTNGNYIDAWGSTGSEVNQFQFVMDIAFDRLDNAFTVDAFAGPSAVKKFSYGINLTTADNLACGTQYYVRAFSTTNNSTPGGTGQSLAFSTTACPGTPPGPPENLLVASADGVSALLDWDAPANPGSSPITDYLIEFRQAGEADWTPYPNTVSTNTSQSIISLNPETTYYFRAFAVSNDGVSLPSNEATLTYTVDIAINTTLLNTTAIKNGDVVAYRNTLTNNGPGATTFQNAIPLSIHIPPPGFTYSATNSSSVACQEANANALPYLEQFYANQKIIACLPIVDSDLSAGQSLTYEIVGSANMNYSTGAEFKSLGINFFAAHRERVEFNDQLTILSGILLAFSGDFSQPSSATNIFSLPFNNIFISTYNYTPPTSTPSPSPTATTSSTPSPSVTPTPSPPASPSPTTPAPTTQPNPVLPNPLFPKYPPEGVDIPRKSPAPSTSESNFLTGFIPEGVLNTIRMTPSAIALALPFFIILVLIALAVLYARQAWLEYRTIAKVRSIIERYHSTKEASQNFVALTSHYLNTPVNILQASAELLASTKAISQANLNKLNIAITNLAEDIKKLVTESQKTTSRVAESTTELDKLRLKNPLLSVFVIVPSAIVVLILFILNLLFTATDRYSLSFALIVAQITALVLGIGLLALSWHSYKRNQASRDALKHQLTLEADILARRVAFITQSYSDLNADLGLVKALMKDIPQASPAQKTLQNGITMLEDVLKKFGRLINFSRPLEALPAPISIAPVIEAAIKKQKGAITQKNITVESQVPVNITAPLTQEAVEQLISSIVDNAVKFNKQAGRLKISTKNTKRGMAITFVDTGIGIEKTKLSQLMTPFSRATDVLKFDYEGIGLNLYLDKVLLEQVGGELHIASAQNKGTTVTLILPEVKQ